MGTPVDVQGIFAGAERRNVAPLGGAAFGFIGMPDGRDIDLHRDSVGVGDSRALRAEEEGGKGPERIRSGC